RSPIPTRTITSRCCARRGRTRLTAAADRRRRFAMAQASARTGHRLTLDHVTHRFGDVTAVDDITLDIAGGELVALLGPSGSGKSPLLRIIAGFIAQSEGRVLFDGEAVDHLAPTRRGAGIVFQNYALFP